MQKTLNSLKDELIPKDSVIRKKMMIALNYMRSNPQNMIPYLEKRKQCYQIKKKSQPKQPGSGNSPNSTTSNKILLFSPFHPHKGISTKQGSKPLPHLIGQLYSHQKLPKIKQIQYLSLGAQHIAFELSTCQIDQIQLDLPLRNYLRKTLNQSQQINFMDKVNCLVSVSFADTKNSLEWEPLLTLLVDDGNEKRTNRRLLLDRDQRYVGVGQRKLQKYPELTVSVYLLTGKVALKG